MAAFGTEKSGESTVVLVGLRNETHWCRADVSNTCVSCEYRSASRCAVSTEP